MRVTAEACRCFNEAEAIKPRIRRGIWRIRAMALGFNEAEAIKPRIPQSAIRIDLLYMRFNEAEAIKPRIPARSGDSLTIERAASMRPRR